MYAALPSRFVLASRMHAWDHVTTLQWHASVINCCKLMQDSPAFQILGMWTCVSLIVLWACTHGAYAGQCAGCGFGVAARPTQGQVQSSCTGAALQQPACPAHTQLLPGAPWQGRTQDLSQVWGLLASLLGHMLTSIRRCLPMHHRRTCASAIISISFLPPSCHH